MSDQMTLAERLTLASKDVDAWLDNDDADGIIEILYGEHEVWSDDTSEDDTSRALPRLLRSAAAELASRLSLSEIEARLTPTVWREAQHAGSIVPPIEHLGDNLAARHRAWLDVILAALMKE